MGVVSLVCMPWHALSAPSIQIGTLQAVLQRRGIPCRAHSLHLEFLSAMSRADPGGCALLTPSDYIEIGDRWFMLAPGEWIFAQPPIRAADRTEERRYLARLRRAGVSNRIVRRLVALRERVPAFLAACAAEILEDAPSIVGFTTTFGQTVASLALASVLKDLAPEVTIVFGGANCEGPMGEALHRSFDVIDVVVRGEGEVVLPDLVHNIRAGETVHRLPGVCSRENGRTVVVPERAEPGVAMDDVPIPDYTEYFDRLERLGLTDVIQPSLPYESSRGCWWGDRSHCTFCGLNGQLMKHRAKSPERVVTDLISLAERHGTLDFAVVDNILDLGYFRTVLPQLRDLGLDLRLFYQTKANLSLPQVRLLRDAGVRCIRPGIESLSTPILKLMRKGVTALHNIRTLKWCAQYGIHVAWNVIHGIPGEPGEEYRRMASLAPWLVHLPPPALVSLTLDRFSCFHNEPDRYGIRVSGPPRHYRALYDVDEATLGELAWTFEFEVADAAARRPQDYVAALREQIERWRTDAHRNQGALTFRRGPSFTVIHDSRSTVGNCRYVLDELESKIYLGCDAGRDPAALAEELSRGNGRSHTAAEVRGILDQLVAEHLVYEEHGRYLSLAIPEDSLVCSPDSLR